MAIRNSASEAAKLAREPLSQVIRKINAMAGGERRKMEKTLELPRDRRTLILLGLYAGRSNG